jgi:glycopeptide antibiotics resistance protein
MRTTDILPLGAIALAATAILTVIACARQKRTFGQGLRLFVVRFGGLWYALVAVTLLFKLGTIKFAVDSELSPFYKMNLVPFRTLENYFARHLPTQIAQIIGNIAVLLPLPILLRLNFPKISFRRVAAISVILTVLIEPLQLLVNVIIRAPYNSIDIDDLILNAVGAVIGLCVAKAIMTVRKGLEK